jgi:hypothetical protein
VPLKRPYSLELGNERSGESRAAFEGSLAHIANTHSPGSQTMALHRVDRSAFLPYSITSYTMTDSGVLDQCVTLDKALHTAQPAARPHVQAVCDC